MSVAVQPLPPDDGTYELVHMLTPTRAVDLYLGDLARRSRSKSGRTASSYRRVRGLSWAAVAAETGVDDHLLQRTRRPAVQAATTQIPATTS